MVESSEERDAIFTNKTDTLSNVADHRHIPEDGSCNFFAYKANKGVCGWMGVGVGLGGCPCMCACLPACVHASLMCMCM